MLSKNRIKSMRRMRGVNYRCLRNMVAKYYKDYADIYSFVCIPDFMDADAVISAREIIQFKKQAGQLDELYQLKRA